MRILIIFVIVLLLGVYMYMERSLFAFYGTAFLALLEKLYKNVPERFEKSFVAGRCGITTGLVQ